MASIPRYGDSVPSQKKAQGSRRSWNVIEEQELINCLKEMLTNGWKADNGFRPGYLGALEIALRARLPASKILLKHINSKLTVWKKHYYQILGMQGTSGFGWSDSGNMITVDDDVWQLYVKAHPEVANMRFKTYIYYNDWVEIFGKDRATGDDVEGFVEIVQDLVKSNQTPDFYRKGKEPMVVGQNDEPMYSSPCVDLTTDASDGAESLFDVGPCGMGFDKIGLTKKYLGKKQKKEKITKAKQERKRKTPESMGSEHNLDIEKFIVAAQSTWGDLTSKFAKEEDSYDEKAKKIIAALENIPTLSDENRNYLSFKITDNSKHTSLFLNSTESNREIQAHMMLDGKMP